MAAYTIPTSDGRTVRFREVGEPIVEQPTPELRAERAERAARADFTLLDEGTILVLTPQTDAARGWVDDHIPDDATRWAGGVVVEHRFITDVLFGTSAAGLTTEVT
jgi:hypothetical protein